MREPLLEWFQLEPIGQFVNTVYNSEQNKNTTYKQTPACTSYSYKA